MIDEKLLSAKRCFRMLVGSILLNVLLSFEYNGIAMTLVKYLLFFAIALLTGYSPRKKQASVSKSVVVLCAASTVIFTVLLSYFLPSEVTVKQVTPLWVMSVVIFTPIAEELFFRGALIYPDWKTLTCISSSLIFAVFHMNDVIQAFVLGLLFSAFYVLTGNISVSIICHALNNLLAVLCIFRDVRIYALIVAVMVLVLILIKGVKNEEKIL